MVDFQSRDTRRGIPTEDSRTNEAPDDEEQDGATRPAGSDDGDEPAPVGFAVVSVGTERTVDRDPAGDAVVEEIERQDGHIVTREVLNSRYDGVQSEVESLVDRRDVHAIVTTGGTGVEPDDVTIEAIESMLDKQLPGFGELLRLLCQDIAGSAVIRTRATAGTIDRVPVFCLPGDAELSRHAVSEIVLPEADELSTLAGHDES